MYNVKWIKPLTYCQLGAFTAYQTSDHTSAGGLHCLIIQYKFIYARLYPQAKYGVTSPKFIWAPCAQLYSLAEPLPPPPAYGLICEGAIGQPRQTTSLFNPIPAPPPLEGVSSTHPYPPSSIQTQLRRVGWTCVFLLNKHLNWKKGEQHFCSYYKIFPSFEAKRARTAKKTKENQSLKCALEFYVARFPVWEGLFFLRKAQNRCTLLFIQHHRRKFAKPALPLQESRNNV